MAVLKTILQVDNTSGNNFGMTGLSPNNNSDLSSAASQQFVINKIPLNVVTTLGNGNRDLQSGILTNVDYNTAGRVSINVFGALSSGLAGSNRKLVATTDLTTDTATDPTEFRIGVTPDTFGRLTGINTWTNTNTINGLFNANTLNGEIKVPNGARDDFSAINNGTMIQAIINGLSQINTSTVPSSTLDQNQGAYADIIHNNLKNEILSVDNKLISQTIYGNSTIASPSYSQINSPAAFLNYFGLASDPAILYFVDSSASPILYFRNVIGTGNSATWTNLDTEASYKINTTQPSSDRLFFIANTINQYIYNNSNVSLFSPITNTGNILTGFVNLFPVDNNYTFNVLNRGNAQSPSNRWMRKAASPTAAIQYEGSQDPTTNSLKLQILDSTKTILKPRILLSAPLATTPNTQYIEIRLNDTPLAPAIDSSTLTIGSTYTGIPNYQFKIISSTIIEVVSGVRLGLGAIYYTTNLTVKNAITNSLTTSSNAAQNTLTGQSQLVVSGNLSLNTTTNPNLTTLSTSYTPMQTSILAGGVTSTLSTITLPFYTPTSIISGKPSINLAGATFLLNAASNPGGAIINIDPSIFGVRLFPNASSLWNGRIVGTAPTNQNLAIATVNLTRNNQSGSDGNYMVPAGEIALDSNQRYVIGIISNTPTTITPVNTPFTWTIRVYRSTPGGLVIAWPANLSDIIATAGFLTDGTPLLTQDTVEYVDGHNMDLLLKQDEKDAYIAETKDQTVVEKKHYFRNKQFKAWLEDIRINDPNKYNNLMKLTERKQIEYMFIEKKWIDPEN